MHTLRPSTLGGHLRRCQTQSKLLSGSLEWDGITATTRVGRRSVMDFRVQPERHVCCTATRSAAICFCMQRMRVLVQAGRYVGLRTRVAVSSERIWDSMVAERQHWRVRTTSGLRQRAQRAQRAQRGCLRSLTALSHTRDQAPMAASKVDCAY